MEMTTPIYNYAPEASHWNISNPVDFKNIEMNSNFVWLMICSLLSAIFWVIYSKYCNSIVAGYIITKIVNRLFIRDGYFKIGSFRLNALAGKIMFRDIVYITHDYSIRIQDGYLIFHWRRSHVPKDVSEDLAHSNNRLSVVLNGFELHVYNSSMIFAHLEKVFSLESHIYLENDDNDKTTIINKTMNLENKGRSGSNSTEDRSRKKQRSEAAMARTWKDDNDKTIIINKTRNLENNGRSGSNSTEDRSRKKQRSEAALARTWRDLIPVTKIDISSSRLVFGNRLISTTLSIAVEESHFVFSAKEAVNTLDRFMDVKSKAENVRVVLAPSPKYIGMLNEPPRYMGEGFVLMSTNEMELYSYMYEPGLVSDEPVHVTLANGDVVESSSPMWGMDIKWNGMECGKCIMPQCRYLH